MFIDELKIPNFGTSFISNSGYSTPVVPTKRRLLLFMQFWDFEMLYL